MIYSHANPLALAANGRNIRDDQIDACVATGGIVCVNGVGRFLGDPQARTPAILRHIDYLVQRVGADHVGLGLDYVYDQGLDDDPPGLERARWWPPEHGYGKDGPRIKIAAPEQFPEITRGPARHGLRRGRRASDPRREHAGRRAAGLAAARGRRLADASGGQKIDRSLRNPISGRVLRAALGPAHGAERAKNFSIAGCDGVHRQRPHPVRPFQDCNQFHRAARRGR